MSVSDRVLIESDWLAPILTIAASKRDDLSHLANVCGYDERGFYLGTVINGADLRGQDLRGVRFSDFDIDKVVLDCFTQLDRHQLPDSSYLNYVIAKIRAIASLSRQEERLACVCYIMYHHPEYSSHIRKYYRPKAKFEARGMELFELINASLVGPDDDTRSIIICRCLGRLWNISFPNSRGVLLTFLAMYMGNIASFAEFINRRNLPNYTMKDHYRLINEIMAAHKEGRRMSVPTLASRDLS